MKKGHLSEAAGRYLQYIKGKTQYGNCISVIRK